MLRSALGTASLLVLALLGIMLLFSLPASAQIGATALRGVVKDPSGAVVPNVSLTLRDKATGLEKTTVSGARTAPTSSKPW